jgi:hypothetical protein
MSRNQPEHRGNSRDWDGEKEVAMISADRVALVAALWFVLWIGGGDLIGRLWNMPETGAVFGFIAALGLLVA